MIPTFLTPEVSKVISDRGRVFQLTAKFPGSGFEIWLSRVVQSAGRDSCTL